MSEKPGSFNLKSVPTYRTRTFTKKAYRTNVPYRTAILDFYALQFWRYCSSTLTIFLFIQCRYFATIEAEH